MTDPRAWLRAGSSAVVSENEPFDQLFQTITRLMRISPSHSVSPAPLSSTADPPDARRRGPRIELFARLTEREQVVLSELMEGNCAEDIAKAAFVSISTVRSQIKAILQKLGVNSQLAAVAMARRPGVPEPRPATLRNRRTAGVAKPPDREAEGGVRGRHGLDRGQLIATVMLFQRRRTAHVGHDAIAPRRDCRATAPGSMKVAVFGLGYVGTFSAACLAANGHDVWGVDPDEMKVAAISAGHSPVVDPGSNPCWRNRSPAGTLHASVRPDVALEGAEVSLLCVGTPSTTSGEANLAHIYRVVEDLIQPLSDSLGTGLPHDHHSEYGLAGHRRRRHRCPADLAGKRGRT